MDIGLWLQISSLDFPLYTGVTTATFIWSGKIPWKKLSLNKLLKTCDTGLHLTFRNLVDIP